RPLLSRPRLPSNFRPAVQARALMRVPMLSGSRLVVVTAEDDALVLRPPPPANAVADVGAAVRDAVRFPLAGQPLEALVPHGGPAALVGASGPEVLRAAGAYSLLETSASQGWRLGLELERALLRRVPMIGASLVLNHPRFGGTLGGYPYETQALERVVRSPLRYLFRALPGGLRAYVMRSLPLERSVANAYACPPSVAHTDALLR